MGALLVVAAIAVGLPVIAWALSRDLKPPRQWTGRRRNHIDRWLYEQYELTTIERWQVEDALYRDPRKITDPRLGDAVYALTAELASGRLKTPWLIRWFARGALASGLAVTTLGIIVVLISPRQDWTGACYIIEGVIAVTGGSLTMFWAPRRLQRNLQWLAHEPAGTPQKPNGR